MKKEASSRENRLLAKYGGDGEIRTLAGFDTPTAFRERTLQPLGYISVFISTSVAPRKTGRTDGEN